MPDAWEYIKAGEFDAAVLAYTVELKKTASAFNYCNRAKAYLNLRHYSKALEDLNKAEQIEREEQRHASINILSDSIRKKIGTVHWAAGEESQAAAVWEKLLSDHEERRIVYTDAAGGIETPCLVWFAGISLSQSDLVHRAEKFLKKQLRTKQSSSWPGPLGAFLLKKISEAELLSYAGRSEPLKQRHFCQAWFWGGVRAVQAEEPSRAMTFYYDAAMSKAYIEDEMYLAAAELKKLAH